MAKAKFEERAAWILAWIEQSPSDSVNILDAAFVDAYSTECGVKSQLQFYGAAKCPQLGSDLSKMYKQGLLTRNSYGMPPGSVNEGFPRWIYIYRKA